MDSNHGANHWQALDSQLTGWLAKVGYTQLDTQAQAAVTAICALARLETSPEDAEDIRIATERLERLVQGESRTYSAKEVAADLAKRATGEKRRAGRGAKKGPTRRPGSAGDDAREGVSLGKAGKLNPAPESGPKRKKKRDRSPRRGSKGRR